MVRHEHTLSPRYLSIFHSWLRDCALDVGENDPLCRISYADCIPRIYGQLLNVLCVRSNQAQVGWEIPHRSSRKHQSHLDVLLTDGKRSGQPQGRHKTMKSVGDEASSDVARLHSYS